jgi:septal ring factor EnvC (AmiA/AmiB activator)
MGLKTEAAGAAKGAELKGLDFNALQSRTAAVHAKIAVLVKERDALAPTGLWGPKAPFDQTKLDAVQKKLDALNVQADECQRDWKALGATVKGPRQQIWDLEGSIDRLKASAGTLTGAKLDEAKASLKRAEAQLAALNKQHGPAIAAWEYMKVANFRVFPSD